MDLRRVNPAVNLIAGAFVSTAAVIPFVVIAGTLLPQVLDSVETDSVTSFGDKFWTNFVIGKPLAAFALGSAFGCIAALWQRASVFNDYDAICRRIAFSSMGRREDARSVALKPRWKIALIQYSPLLLLALLDISIVVGQVGFVAGYNITIFPTMYRVHRDSIAIQDSIPLDAEQRQRADRHRKALGMRAVATFVGSLIATIALCTLTATKVVPMARKAVEIHNENKRFEQIRQH